jgi:hypothetical protein
LYYYFWNFYFRGFPIKATFIDYIKEVTGLKFSGVKLIFSTCLIIPLIIFWLTDNRILFRKFIMIYVFIDTVRLLFAIFLLVESISVYTGIEGGNELFEDVIFIWFINVIVFGCMVLAA